MALTAVPVGIVSMIGAAPPSTPLRPHVQACTCTCTYTCAQMHVSTDTRTCTGMFGRGSKCSKCPRGGFCPGPDKLHSVRMRVFPQLSMISFCALGGSRLWPLPGFWGAGEHSGTIGACTKKLDPEFYDHPNQKCLGGPQCPDCCNEGYTGEFCASCAKDYYRERARCLPCQPGQKQKMQIFMALFVLIFNSWCAYSYDPISLWPYIVMAICSYSPM